MQFNKAEQTALLQSLSNDARILYILGIKPTADESSGTTSPLNYKSLLSILNAREEKFTLGRQVNSLIKELISVGLVNFQNEVELNHSFNGKTLVLPLTTMKVDEYSKLHLNWHTMHLDWLPNQKLISDLAKLVGIIDYDYTTSELGDFIAYWLGRPESQFSEYQWTQKFVFNLKKMRLAHGFKNVQKVGQQIVQTKAGILADDNAKNLVAKYSKTNT
ncbi:DnaT-like ssDNA-binding domain-containing protein [Paraglaciecola arctica]|uniref:Flavodoxin n=1 Tax=Paraglaciecola arctica BSs20135 TaxID=493475 RepID=K6YFV4_9ALTE|nr:DnaT-like ssDNA-binding domain-containing protein [Paraglaciecola arctica]GAC17042.1 flavodoxin [Paraglaciecola arctica BSs20135]|tara:strand:+ start:5388 stop:6041 length:654 start_codon:yes stop_codon:yes gene_type:complete